MPRNKKGQFVSASFPEVVIEKAELLTVEAHPTMGRIERWRMSDGSVISITLEMEWVEK